METLGKYVVEIVLGLISAGALAFCKYLSSQLKSYKKLLDRGYLTQEELAVKMGKTQGSISNKLRLLNLSNEVQDALLNNE